MADQKISNLTAATTPLAGTEVLPLVQSGTTKKVPVSDLTSGRSVATGDLTTTGTATISGNAAIGTTTPRTSANKKLLTIDSAWGGQVDIGVGGVSHAQFGSDNYDTGNSCRIQSADNIVMKVSGGTLVGSFTSNGFAPESGKGIDFSATANGSGTMTSELLSDYEEGTWTPTLHTETVDLTSVGYLLSTGTYTRNGRSVLITGTLITNAVTKGAGSGAVTIRGLPFTAGPDAALNIGTSNYWLSVQPIGGYVSGAKLFPQYRATSTSAGVAMNVANIDTGAFSNYILFSATYSV